MMVYAENKGYIVGLGAIKNYVKEKLDKINFPLVVIKNHKLTYEPEKHNDPLLYFFQEEKTGKVWPVFVRLGEAKNYLHSIFYNIIAFKKIDKNHILLKSKFLFNFILFLKFLNK